MKFKDKVSQTGICILLSQYQDIIKFSSYKNIVLLFEKNIANQLQRKKGFDKLPAKNVKRA